MVTAYFLMLPTVDDILLLAVIFSVLVMAAYAGRLTRHTHMKDASPEPAVITGATLTLSGLLIGFVFSVSLSGYSAREQAEVREAQSVAGAWQYTMQLPVATQQKVHPVLKKYLAERIRFFGEDTTLGGRVWSRMAEEKQWQLWRIITPEAERNPTPVMASVLAAFSAQMTAQQLTCAVWKRQIPDAAWLVLIVFAASACFLVGYHYHERGVHHFYLLLLPTLTSLVLFMIAEIDIPGQGIIRVMPDDLAQLAEFLAAKSEGTSHDLSMPVYHVP